MKTLGFREDELLLTMRRKDIANFLGLAGETVSRLITMFHAEGILRVNKSYVKINDLRKL
jgi:CRP-like cAMP-binding protein